MAAGSRRCCTDGAQSLAALSPEQSPGLRAVELLSASARKIVHSDEFAQLSDGAQAAVGTLEARLA